jgi:sugar (pentulose or hexulose) kinase
MIIRGQKLEHGWAIVVDIGKTLSKVTLWSRDGRLLDRQSRPNAPVTSGGIARLDTGGIAGWLIDTMAMYADQPIEVIVPVGHGAGVAAIANDVLAFTPLDYEQAIPPDILAAYRAERDDFAITGSPALPDGLNLGAQLHWLEHIEPGAVRRSRLLPWAQYWTWFLSGEAASEVSSLGCHTDLWLPAVHRYAPLAQRRGWAERFAPLARAADVAGTLRPQLAARTGLSPATRVLVGLHDSNAALLAARGHPGIADADATVLSTGTWFVAMRSAQEAFDVAVLPAGRDCLANVDVHGKTVPSARFMGGREIELVIEAEVNRVDIAADQSALLTAAQRVLADGTMLLPTLAPGCGPFPDGRAPWLEPTSDRNGRRAAACLYAALVADAALDLIGARERLLIEGRFAKAEVFVRALAALRPETRVMAAQESHDVSFGALRLIDPTLAPHGDLQRIAPLPHDIAAYRDRWRAQIGAGAIGVTGTAGTGIDQCMHRSANS